MRNISVRLTFFGLVVALAPAFAGNYAEGDPRPAVQPSQLSVAQLQAQTRQWRASAPTIGYPEGNPHVIVATSQKTRAQVHAEAVAWTQSGMSEIANGEVAMDSRGSSYDRTLQAFQQLSSDHREAAASIRAPASR